MNFNSDMNDKNEIKAKKYLQKTMSESIYRPNFYRQRSMSCDHTWGHHNQGFEDDGEETTEKQIHIRVIRRKSLGFNMKLGNADKSDVNAINAINASALVQTDVNKNNELVISIPVIIEDDNPITKNNFDIDIEEPFPLCEPQMQSSWTVLKQMLIPFLIAGFGSVGAGIVLNNVQHWPAFIAIPQLIIMIPSFLGLIGNIETTLASRLSTHANLGTLDNASQLKTMIVGNSSVVLCQASTVGLFAAFASLAVYYIKSQRTHTISLSKLILLLCASSVATSVIANTILATAISVVIIIARKVNVNPDNIATPVAASMGDVCTITLLAIISDFLYKHSTNGNEWISIGLLIGLLLSAPVMGYIARKNKYTRSVILTGWTPILGAVIIEQPGGLVMESAFDKYDVMSTFQPLVNGIGSNLVGIQTSRLSTFLHQTSPKGKLPKSNPRACVQPLATFIGRDVHSRMARLLLGITVPAHLFYLGIIYFWQKNFTFTAPFVISYLIAVVAQIAILLYLAYVSVLWAWKRHINPDNSAIPFTSALADVLGNCLMAAAFTFLDSINDVNAQVDDSTSISPTMSTFTAFMNSTTNSSIHY